MITGDDLYKVMCAMVPLYFAMLVAYASVKWCKMFTPDQCSGINRFVAVFAVPVLSFHFISINNPYQMDIKFIIADTISKLLVLLLLSLWAIFFTKGSLDWLITLFSLATLPNTLVMGIPLLQAMYGDFTQSLMVQLVVLQCIIWYTLLLFLFEYRAATLLIQSQFPGPTAASITKIELDGDIISLDGHDMPLRTESETDNNGRICVRIRRSVSSAPESNSSIGNGNIITPRISNLSNADIFSINTPLQLHAGDGDLAFGYASSDAYSLQPTPRASNFNEMETTATSTPAWGRSPVSAGRVFRQSPPALSGARVVWESPGKCQGEERQGCKDITMSEISFRDSIKFPMPGEAADTKDAVAGNQKMPHAFVMIRLTLIVVGRKLSRNPNTYSSVLGLVWSLISFKWNMEMPSLIKSSIKIISDAGLGMAMFSLGLFMALQPRIIACGTKRAAMGMAIRFLCGPLVMSASSIAVGLRRDKLHTAIVQAALPQGIVPFVFAREYGLHPDILSTGVIFGMLVSLPITLLYYIFLGL
ncbi:auxin efflux carrier component 6 isoform X2 [Gastrolobium bilobum]|uniref:auxin efflux carrier component 6 isoform X2 n=1 Tax=Gastrolobium bilobum TaxID=150636 RepID=UPI002AB1EB84|nr:auxin efflux carrier component 6 isoform X2 [Gastrolobium bilobum]